MHSESLLKQLSDILHPQGELTKFGFYALVGDTHVSIMKESAKIGEWRQRQGQLEFTTAAGVPVRKFEAETAKEAVRQTIELVMIIGPRLVRLRPRAFQRGLSQRPCSLL